MDGVTRCICVYITWVLDSEIVSCMQDRENQRVQWLRSCVDELINNTWVLPALKQMEEIFGLFPEVAHGHALTC